MENEDLDKEYILNICSELRRAISRLSYVGMGMSDELDHELNKLRKTIRQDDELPEIKKNIDRISNILRTLGENDDGNKQASEQLDVLSLLLKKQLPSQLRKQLKLIKKGSKSKDAATIVRAIVDVIDGYIKQVENQHLTENNKSASPLGHSKKPGFFAKLFSFGKAKTEQAGNQVHYGLSTAGSQNEILASNINVTETHPISEFNLPPDIEVSLQHLINQLASMDDYADVADRLKQEMEKISKLAQLSSILEMITNAFVKISDQEHIQFEKFLKTLNARIIRVNDFITQTLYFSKSSQNDSRQLNTDFTTNIDEMKSSLSAASTLKDAKATVFSHMDTITNQLDRFCEKQGNDSQVLVEQMDKLSEQLKATEDESSRLKDDLAEQRVRAQTDPLTQLPNRYSYSERLTQEYNRWRRYHNPLSLVMGDIDLFKLVNDQHGHAFGDNVLREIASFLSSSVRESDFIARFGGEEFVILLPETGLIDATRAMNKIRSGVSKLKIKNDGQIVPVTMSFGISEFDQGDTAKSVFERADKALYRAKGKGRNLVCCLRAKSA